MSYTPLLDMVLGGGPVAPTPTAGDNDTSVATTQFVQTELGDYLPLAGGTMTGDLVLAGDPDAALKAATKQYVDSVAAGIRDWKDSVQLVHVGSNLTLSGEQTLDGVLTSSSRVLVTAQTLPEENGIYVTGAGAWTRAADADTSAEVTAGLSVFVTDGTTYGDTAWVLSTNDPITLGTTGLTFVQFSSTTVISNISDLGDVDTASAADGALLRYESGTGNWEDTTSSNLLLSDAGQLQVPTVGASAGILLGGDANLYRSAADVLKTDDDMHVGASIQMDASAGLIATLIDGSAGGLTFGAGSDVNLYRSAANVLKTDDSLAVGADATISGRTVMSGGQRFAVVTKTADYSAVLASDMVILADNSGDTADLIITLPSSHAAGDVIHVKDAGGNAASGTNQILISPDAGDEIDSNGVGVDFELTVNHQSVTLISDGTNWYLI